MVRWPTILASALAPLLSLPAPFPVAGRSAPPGATRAADQDGEQEGADLDDLKRTLRTDRPEKRRVAVKRLAERGEREAWQLVIEALEDRKAEVADEAQFQLAGLDDEKLLRALFGRGGLRAKDPWVRLRVAEAFGRMRREIDGTELLSHVSRGEPELSSTLLWSVERLARSGWLVGDGRKVRRALSDAWSSRAPAGMRAAALAALAAIDPEAAAPLVRAGLTERDPLLRVAALEGIDTLGEEGALGACRALAGDEDPRVRFQVLDALSARAAVLGREAALVLCERLALEQRPRLRWRALEILQRVSGLKHRLDPRPWRLWASELAPDWRPAPAGAVTELGSRTVAFAGMPVLSDRVCFLVDFSGSLWYEREGRPPRKLAVDARLREVLPALPEEALFNVVPYTEQPHPWMEGLVASTPANVRRALAWFERCTERGTGNFFDAALLALADPHVDTIVVLTDGAPTGGRRWKLELMMPLLVEANRYRKVVFDSIVVDAQPGLRKHWTWLAQATGGRSIAIEL